MTAKYFRSPAEFRRWLAAHHDTERELVVGFYKKASGKIGISYKEAVDEALCFGWIDGVKHRVDEERYTHRFTPRKAVSIWSNVNTRRMEELIGLKRVAAPGMAAYTRRDPKRSGIYQFESRQRPFPPALLRQFKENAAAWAFFSAQPPGYQRLLTFYVVSAKQEETQLRRLGILMKTSAAGKRMQ